MCTHLPECQKENPRNMPREPPMVPMTPVKL